MNALRTALLSARTTILAHRRASIIIAIVLLVGGYLTYAHASSTSTETRYVLGTVSRGTIVASVSGSGQVSASNQLDVKPKVSGEITYVGVVPGQHVSTGQIIAEIDSTDAQKSVRDAKANLASAQLSLQKLQEPATTLSLTQAQNALSSSQDNLAKLYTQSSTDIVNTFLDLPGVIANLQSALTTENTTTNTSNLDAYFNSISQDDPRAQTYRDTAYNDYVAARAAYDKGFSDYQSFGTSPDSAAIEQMLEESYETTKAVSTAEKSAVAFLQFYKDTMQAHNRTVSTTANSALSTLTSDSNTANGHLSTLLSDTNALTQDKQDITEKQQSLDQVNAGPDSLDVQGSQLSVQKAQNALTDAENNLANYTIRAPFSGTVAAVDAKKYDQAGSSAIATLITPQQIAELSLNEVDVAKIKLGDKATLTFDAIDGLSLTGSVIEIDTIGTVSQGVVSYDVKIGFDSQDSRIKPGMTVNAAIITDIHSDVLEVPSSALKSLGGNSYVLSFSPPLSDASSSASGVTSDIPPQQIPVEIGISDDTNTEITSGLTEGQQIVVRTVSAAKTTVSSAPSLLGGGGARAGAAGGAARGNATFIAR